MPKTRNFSDREKRDPMRLLDIHNHINAVYLFMQTLSFMRREGNLFRVSAAYLFAAALRLLTDIHHPTLRPRPKKLRRRQNATLSENSFSLSAKRTISEKLITKKQVADSPAPTSNATIQPPANPIRPTAPASSPDSKKFLPKKTDYIYTVSIHLRNLALELEYFKGAFQGQKPSFWMIYGAIDTK